MKKLIALLLTGIAVVSMTACGGGKASSAAAPAPAPAASSAAPAAPAAPAASAASSEAAAPAEQYLLDFELYNYTGGPIVEIYCSPSGAESWEEDVLGVDILENEASVHISFVPAEQTQYWDVMAVGSQGGTMEFYEVDLYAVSELALYFDGTNASYEVA